MREALRDLVEAGLLEFIPHRGIFIRKISITEAIEAYEIRAGLFGLAGSLAVTPITDDELDALAQVVETMDARLNEGDTANYHEDNLDLHARLVASTRNKRLVQVYHNLVKELHLLHTINLQSTSHLVSSQKGHEEMLAAWRAGDEMGAYRAHYLHVIRAKERVLEI